jgi:hypothetical protein
MRAALPLLFAAACIDSERPPTVGQLGELEFVDLTVHADDNRGAAGLAWPVAVGAELELGVYGWDEQDGELATSIVEGDAFSLVRDVGTTLRLRAEAAGEVTLLVLADDGREDRITLRSADIDVVELFPHGDGTLLTPAVPEALTTNGWAALPGAEIGLASFLYDVNGDRLTGYADLPWTASGDSTTRPFDRVANGAWAVVGASTGDQSFSAGFGSNFPVRVLAEADDRTFHLYEADYDDPTELLAIEAEAGLGLFGALLFDEAGRYLVPPANANLTAEVLDGPVNLVTVSEYSTELLGFSATLCPGTGTVRLTLAGATRDYAITVTGADCE